MRGAQIARFQDRKDRLASPLPALGSLAAEWIGLQPIELVAPQVNWEMRSGKKRHCYHQRTNNNIRPENRHRSHTALLNHIGIA